MQSPLALLLVAVLQGAPAAAADADAAALQERGRRIVNSGTEAGATACAACHGQDGAGRGPTGIPTLAGQSTAYLTKQLGEFRSGVRRHFFMQPTATVLTDEDIAAVAHYYSSLKPVSGRPDDAKVLWQDLALGSWIAERGIGDRAVPSCNSCHGENGNGVAPVFPRLIGQSAAYIKRQLKELKSGGRANDPAGMMRNLASRLEPQEISAVAHFYEWLGTVQPTAAPASSPDAPAAKPAAAKPARATPAKPLTPAKPARPTPAKPTAAGATPAPTTAASAARIAEEALSLYRVRCAPCHGAAGAGDGAAAVALTPKPRSFANQAWQAGVTDDHLRKIILQGGPSVGLSPLMPGNPDLTAHPDTVTGLVGLVRSFGR